MTDTISRKQLKEILKSQLNKCARKPYARIKHLEKHKCKSWEQNIDIQPKSCHIIKTKNDYIALCNDCYVVYSKNRQITKQPKKPFPPVKQDFVSPLSLEMIPVPDPPKDTKTHSKGRDDTKHIIGKYQVVYNHNNKNCINVHDHPSDVSKVIHKVYFEDVLNVYNILTVNNDIWLKVIVLSDIGYVKTTCNGMRAVIKIDDFNSMISSKAEVPETKISISDCRICFEKITELICVVPCGHTQVCKPCMDKHTNTSRLCPLCLQFYEKYINCYI